LFSWTPAATEQTLDALARAGVIRQGLSVAGQPGVWAALAELAQ
jgi:hypothetical protein